MEGEPHERRAEASDVSRKAPTRRRSDIVRESSSARSGRQATENEPVGQLEKNNTDERQRESAHTQVCSLQGPESHPDQRGSERASCFMESELNRPSLMKRQIAGRSLPAPQAHVRTDQMIRAHGS